MNQPFYNRLCQLFVIVMVMVTGLYAQPVVTIPGSTINNGGNSTIPYSGTGGCGVVPQTNFNGGGSPGVAWTGGTVLIPWQHQ